MAKWFGAIGFAEHVETAPGVWTEIVTPRYYYGELIRNTRRLQTSDKVNDDIVINNELSIVSDPYADQNFHTIRYAESRGVRWKVTNVDVQYPRLVLTLGAMHNGE